MSQVKHEARKVSGSIQGRPGRWVCSCGESKTRYEIPPWEDLAEVMQRHWRSETNHACSGVLAALREVAGL